MSGGDLQGQLSVPIGDSEAQLGKVEKGFKKISEAARLAKREAVDYQRDAGRFFRGMQTHAEGAERSMHSLRHAVRFAGEQFELSGVTGGRGIAGALSLEGTFGRIAAGAALAGVALKAYDAVLEATEIRYEMARKAADDFEKAVKSGEAEISKGAKAGLAQQGDIRQLVALGGGGAIKEADDLAADPSNGLTGEQARRGVGRSYLLKGDIRGEAVHAAITANKSGLMTFEEAIDEIAKSPQLQGVLRAGVIASGKGGLEGSAGLGQSRDLVLSTLLSGATGTRISAADAGQITNNVGGYGAGTSYLSEADKTQATLNKIDPIQRARVASGLSAGEAKGELAAAMNPVAQALVALSIAQTKLAVALEQKAGTESFGASVGGTFTPKGNANTQHLRFIDANATFGGG